MADDNDEDEHDAVGDMIDAGSPSVLRCPEGVAAAAMASICAHKCVTCVERPR